MAGPIGQGAKGSPVAKGAAVPAIAVEHLVKRYGVHAAVDDISFEVRAGEVVGFLGPNGAGKSTTLKILAGFLGATSGRAAIAGFDVVRDPHRARASTGYMPEAVPLYGEMRVREYLRFRAELKGVPRLQRVACVGRAMEQAHVADVADTLIDHLSKGYRQRVGLADAIVARPPLLVLDEPTAGMDPNQIREVRALIRELGNEHTVLLSTHILSEVEATCSRVVVIDRGKLVAEGTPKELADLRRPPRFSVTIRGAQKLWKDTLAEHVVCETTDPLDAETFRVGYLVAAGEDVGAAIEEQIASLVGVGVGVRDVSPGKASLEDVFASLTHGDASANVEASAPADAPNEPSS